MNKQFLTATLVAAIFSITFAETPNYDFMPRDFQEFCGEKNIPECQEMATIVVFAQQSYKDVSDFVSDLNEEQREQMYQINMRLEQLQAAIVRKMTASHEMDIKEADDILNQGLPASNEDLSAELKDAQSQE